MNTAIAVLLCAAAVAGAGEGDDRRQPAVGEGFAATTTVIARAVASPTARTTTLPRPRLVRSAARSVADVLQFTPGVRTQTAVGRGGFTVAHVRGGDPNFTLVLVDGVAVNDATDPVGGAFNLAGLPASAVERVDVVRGPLSSYLGSTGLAGLIHVTTRRPPTGERLAEGELEVGAGDLFRAAASLLGDDGGGDAYRLSLAYERERERVAEERFDQLDLTGGWRRRTGWGEVRLDGRFSSWDADDYPEASAGPRLGSGQLRATATDELSGRLHAEVDALAGWRHGFGLSLSRVERARQSPAIGFLVPASDEDTRYLRARADWVTRRSLAAGIAVELGVELDREEARSRTELELPAASGGPVTARYDDGRTLGGGFAGVVLRRGGSLWELGLRADLPEGDTAQWNPRLGFRQAWHQDRTHLTASLARSFKLPSFFALASPPQLGGNRELRPETVVGGDVGIEHRFDDRGSGVQAAVFVSRYRDLVDFDFARFLHVNRAEVSARGVELQAAWSPLAGVLLDGNVTRQEVEDVATDERLRQRPRWFGGVDLSWEVTPRASLSVDAEVTGSLRDQQLPVPDRTEVAGWAVFGLTARARLAPGLEARLRVDNLTDRDYETSIGFPGAGRAVRVMLRYGRGL